ncbi:MAG: outer membrane beta-barrel protein [Proteobacteria bacterium]|nr:outer membrane beta-barrel protein [Desulfocapsa sp.]MBU3945580.1 outer membrane beta-barrel protein [Pseudomonadota bacterium]MCG2745142.1 outer membrane beta-barrel protein [Desulfobacteraceae bacterium]MBU4029787.1 outer membrane beta-barrel protein [Pseudomonadota bacterium]MBU4041610.1 outer membrane beta-barrel protein [Pseudomonadota bacterium]
MKRQYSLLLLSSLLLQSQLAVAGEHQGIQIGKTIMVASNDIQPAAESPFNKEQDMPMGQSSSDSKESLLPEDDGAKKDSELFSTAGSGYLHPFLSVGEEYTDNLYDLDQDKTSNFLTRISPGIWLSVPKVKEVPVTIAANNTSAGGLQMALPDYEGFERFNAYLLGALDYKMYSADSALNDTDAKAEGLFKYNLRGGLSFQALDSYTSSQDRFDIGNASIDPVRRYKSNLGQAVADWDFSEKLRTKAEFSNFYLNYSEAIDDFLDRSDNTASWYGFYKYSPKTSFFVQYQYVDLSYDTNTAWDNTQDLYYAGINWASSEKTSLRMKAGYQNKDYQEDFIQTNTQDNNGLALELALKYQITVKTEISLALNHKIEESDSAVALDKEVSSGTLHYKQQFTEKLLGVCELSVENANYNQLQTGERDDDRYLLRPALQYVFKDWLMAEMAYQYDTRNSTDDLFDYAANTISFSLNSGF